MVTLTEKAKERILELKKEEGLSDDYFLRVDVVGGGCSGLSYKYEFDNTIDENMDRIFENDDIKVVTTVKCLLYIMDTELDYSDGLNGKGFQFNNPNATRSCGCGSSFSV